MRYKKLPKNTSALAVAGILAVGGLLGYGITINGFVAIYGFIGVFAAYFYPAANLAVSSHEAIYLGLLTLTSGITAVWLSFLAFDMNILSKKALSLSRTAIIPTTIATIVVANQHSNSSFAYHLSSTWVLAVAATIPLCGIIPYLFLNTKSARKVHNR